MGSIPFSWSLSSLEEIFAKLHDLEILKTSMEANILYKTRHEKC